MGQNLLRIRNYPPSRYWFPKVQVYSLRGITSSRRSKVRAISLQNVFFAQHARLKALDERVTRMRSISAAILWTRSGSTSSVTSSGTTASRYANSITIRLMDRQKYYVVWKGRKRGIFMSWPECESQVKGFVGARYKAFGTRLEAETALNGDYIKYAGKPSTLGKWKTARVGPILPSLCVDAACSGSPGSLEYQGVEMESGKRIFHAGPFADGTNNIGEFLAIVRAMDYEAKHKLDWPIYSDSENAIGWVKTGRCNTKLVRIASNTMLFELISRAEKTLQVSSKVSVLKWITEDWGENPADFGRK